MARFHCLNLLEDCDFQRWDTRIIRTIHCLGEMLLNQSGYRNFAFGLGGYKNFALGLGGHRNFVSGLGGCDISSDFRSRPAIPHWENPVKILSFSQNDIFYSNRLLCFTDIDIIVMMFHRYYLLFLTLENIDFEGVISIFCFIFVIFIPKWESLFHK